MRNCLMTSVSATLVAIAMIGPASADEIVISGGKKGGAYDRWCKNAATLLTGAGHEAVCLNSKGAEDNVNRIEAGEAQLAWTQADVGMLHGIPGEVMGTFGQECLFLVFKDGAEVDDEDDLQGTKKDGSAPKIGIDKAGSGSYNSWTFITKLEEDYKAAAANPIGGSRALAKLAAGELDAVLFVTSPDALDQHKLATTVANNDNLEFGDFDDKDLNDKLPDGSAVYTFNDDIDVPGAFSDIEAPCTPVIAVASTELSDEALEAISDMFLNNEAALRQ